MPRISSSRAVARTVVVSPEYWAPVAVFEIVVHSPIASASCSANTRTVCAVAQSVAVKVRFAALPKVPPDAPAATSMAPLPLATATVTLPPAGSVDRRTRYVRGCPSRSASGVVWSPEVFGSVSTSTPTSSSATVAVSRAVTPL